MRSPNAFDQGPALPVPPPDDASVAELRAALSATPPALPSKYFYDHHGSALFEDITRLPEYYLTRAEEEILAAVADAVVESVAPEELVEIGAGAARKTQLLLDALAARGGAPRCALVDISETALAGALRRLGPAYPGIRFDARVLDFVTGLALTPGPRRLVALLGSTIGNFDDEDAEALLRRIAVQMTPHDALLLGLDLLKPAAVLEAAYDDSEGITAAFNKNILRVINRTFAADFEPDAFAHVAFWNERHEWIEMRLRARHAMAVDVRRARVRLSLAAGAEIRTEISCKYSRERAVRLCARAGLECTGWFTDAGQRFGLALLRPAPRAHGRRAGHPAAGTETP